jgi:hypothetical protein
VFIQKVHTLLERKNFMVEAPKVRKLARRLGVSESEAVRVAVERLLLEDALMLQIERIRQRGGVRDVYQRARSPRGPRR